LSNVVDVVTASNFLMSQELFIPTVAWGLFGNAIMGYYFEGPSTCYTWKG
jgi:hypothetical protein